MVQLTIEEIRALKPCEYAKYCARVLDNAIYDSNGKAVNIQAVSATADVLSEWVDNVRDPSWNFQLYHYRIKPEPKTRLMTDVECRKFIKDNIRDIIIIDNDSSIELDIKYIFYLFFNYYDISKSYTYIYIKDMDIENPKNTKTNKFEITVQI